MKELKCIAEIDENQNQIIIKGLSEKMILDYAEDIDFTSLVKKLIELFDENKTINLTINTESEDKKVLLILDTVKYIIQQYNTSIDNINSADMDF